MLRTAICQKLHDCLKELQLNPQLCGAQTYDTEENLPEETNGCATVLATALTALSKVCKLPEMTNMMSIVQALGIYFKYSSKRQLHLEKALHILSVERKSQGQPLVKPEKVNLLCETRWVERHTALEDIHQMVEPTFECLTGIAKTKANVLLCSTTNSQFIEAFQTVWAADKEEQCTRRHTRGLLQMRLIHLFPRPPSPATGVTLQANKELINDMIVPLLHQWTKANALFKPPVINQCRTIELKLTKLWHKAVETSLGKGNLARKNEFLHTLDTLFDILTCKCSIQLCSESNCSHSGKRENNSHIDCGCPREKKIPVLELEFIKAQRTKAEGQGSMQMGSIDYSETKKQIANAKKREQIREREQKKKMKSEEAIQREEELCQDVYHFFDIPPINVNATKLSELVDLSLEVLEPPLTTSLTSQELRNLKETPMQVPKWPSHTQSVERCVKMVTEAAGHVYSHERREVMGLTVDVEPLISCCGPVAVVRSCYERL
ncbi:hypothetical protein Hamer_G025652 [Homarus americanus]|uniref:Uncharacterized protein n=1 Tax=Homarus americanus TaxID=6706 RepID=A0A8J5JR92_HOMAM|nr:hypothetical protein Hamer_G025652 [Homarus americanus]